MRALSPRGSDRERLDTERLERQRVQSETPLCTLNAGSDRELLAFSPRALYPILRLGCTGVSRIDQRSPYSRPIQNPEEILRGGLHAPSVTDPAGTAVSAYRGASLIRKCTPLGPYRRPMPRLLGGSYGGGCFLMGEVPL